MCNNTYNIKVVEGNAFALLFPLKRRTYTANIPIDEDINCEQLQDCKVIFGGVEYTPELTADGVRIILPAALKKATYDAIITAEYQGSEIRAAYFEAVTIVAWNEQSNAEQYIQGSPVVMPAAFVIGGTLTDAELEELKAQYRLAIAAAQEAQEAAEQAKADFDAKAEGLDSLADVAQQSTLTQGISDIRSDISGISIDTSTLAQRSDVKSGNDTAIGMLKDQTNGLAAIKSAIPSVADVQNGLATEANATANKNAIIAAMPTGYALQGNGNNTLTDLYNLIGYTISEIDAV